MPAIVGMTIWAGAGGGMLLYLAGLQGIPEELHEAARVDGAGAWQRLRYVIFPMLAPTTLFLLVTGVLGSFQVFVQIFVMTGGGPLDKTTTISYYIYQTAFKFYDMGYATAISWALFAILFVFTIMNFRLARRYAEF
jgi:multiple sugar transport system permease protein